MKKHFLLGLLAGCGIGALLGLLFAPTRGKSTRDRISVGAASAYRLVPLVGARFRIRHPEDREPIKQAI